MAGVLGVQISNLLSTGASFLATIRDSISTPSSSSSSSSSDHESKIHAIEKDMEGLMRMLRRIQATLHDAEMREITDESVQLWLTELRDLAYAADDVLDEWEYDQLKAQMEARNASKGNPNKRKLIEIPDGLADQIKELRCRLDEISKDRESLHLREEDGVRISNSASYPTTTSHLVIGSSIFGRESEKEKVINCLMSNCCESNLTVLPIVGMGGLGKTTLAQLVYNDTRVQRQFDKLGWICVSDDFNVIRITKAIIESLTTCECDLTELSALQDKLKLCIAGKSVFLVLDDVWSDQKSHWESLMAPFVATINARILVTTRNERVALIAQTVPFFKLSVMPDEQCWQLFQYYAFGGFPSVEHLNLQDIGRRIVSKCSGLPLAIKTIASLLRYEMEEERWVEILQSEIWEEYSESEIFGALRISYMRLPEHLKPCLLFCSIFPKDYCYKQKELIDLWYAHDYVKPRGKKSMEEVGKEYVKELKQRSLLEVHNQCRGKEGIKYIIHHMFHTLLCLMSKNAYRELHDDNPINNTNKFQHGVKISNSTSYPSPTSHLVIESGIFGRESEKEKVIKCLMSNFCESNLTVLPIVGMGGLGKTTLAQLVYNDTRVQQQFDKVGWICVSYDFNVIRITKVILESLTKCGCDLTELSTLQENLKSIVADTSVFMVLDDVWNEQQSRWETLMAPFVSAKKVSILVTTRSMFVSKMVQTVTALKLSLIPVDPCWQLFQHYAFGGSPSSKHSNLLELGRRIVSKCGASPLAIKTIGSLLRYERKEERWMEILQSEIWKEYQGVQIFTALQISYMHLPEYLKYCLLSCSSFPSDYCYKQNELINLWCAQEYIMPEGSQTVEEVGTKYIKELNQRAFLEVHKPGGGREGIEYKIHDLNS